jgi:hypothetical protein
MQHQPSFARNGAPFPAACGGSPGLAALALTLFLLPAPLAAAEWSRSVTVNSEVLSSLPATGAVPALPVRRGPTPGAAAVEYRWELLAELGPGSAAAGGGGATAAWSQAYGKAAPALIRPGEPPQWILGTASR